MSSSSWKAFAVTTLLFLLAAYPLRAQNDAAWAEFQQKAASWRALPTKPPLSEEVREARVQAENAFKEKRLADAAAHYDEGLKIDPVWPEGYFNAALIYAELGDYDKAIWRMRAYVELVPDAPDARTGRDQLYVWRDKLKVQKAVGWRDPATGLLWAKQDNGSALVDWNQANAYCQSLSLGGYSGWRLPTEAELITIYDKTQDVNGMHIKGGIKLSSQWVWIGSSAGEADYITFRTGRRAHAFSLGVGGHTRALCVRRSGE